MAVDDSGLGICYVPCVPTQSTTPTLGKELEDLEQAYKKGTITKEEYEAGKKKLLEKGAQPAK